MTPAVLMVTGAFAPEISGGGNQCRTMMRAIGARAAFSVLTTSTTPGLPERELIDGVPITRMPVDVSRASSKAAAAWTTIDYFRRRHREFDIVHLHGFSQKSILIAALARAFGKRLVITMHTAGQDDPDGVRRQGWLAYRAFTSADRVIAISDGMADRYCAAALPAARLRIAYNGVDTDRFVPALSAAERDESRARLGLGSGIPWIGFVGFFSAEKGPRTVYDAWLALRSRTGRETGLVFAGALDSPYYEVDRTIAIAIREDAARRGLEHLVRFTGELQDIERVYQAIDVFVMPSVREAFGMALIEAMATELPVVASSIPGVTDRIVDDGRTGLLVPPGEPAAIADALARVFDDPAAARELGVAARRDVIERFSLPVSAERWMRIYQELMP